MDTAKVINEGEYQIIKLPGTIRFDSDEARVNKIGKSVYLLPKDSTWKNMLTSLDYFTDDFLECFL